MRSYFLFVLLFFSILFSVLVYGLMRHDTPPPSYMVGQTIPTFILPGLTPSESLSNTDILAQKRYSLVNIFASWCQMCLAEHPLLMELATKTKHIDIYGIAWKDEIRNSTQWLQRHGNPYTRIGSDFNGKVITDFGVTGAPETFVIDPDGIIIFHHVGPLTKDIIVRSIIPLTVSIR